MITITAKCKAHKRYKAIRKPTASCSGCWALWELVDEIKQGKPVTYFDYTALGALDPKFHALDLQQ